MPPLIQKGRGAENWRVLISIADTLDRGDIARDAATKFLKESNPTNAKIELLDDIRTIFNESPTTNELPNFVLLKRLQNLQDGVGEWPHLTLTQLGRMLTEFQIKNKTMRWSEYRQLARCYIKSDFTDMWRRYLKPLPPALKVVAGNKAEKK
jgi:hypothetical protein